jgi:hypothetical protein
LWVPLLVFENMQYFLWVRPILALQSPRWSSMRTLPQFVPCSSFPLLPAQWPPLPAPREVPFELVAPSSVSARLWVMLTTSSYPILLWGD